MITHKFHIIFNLVVFDKTIQFEKISEQFKGIEIKPIPDNKYELNINIDSNLTVQDTYFEAEIKANDLIDRLSLLNQEVSSFQYILGFDNKENTAILKGSSNLILELESYIPNPIEYYKLEENLKVFNNSKNSTIKRVFRESQSIKDDISKYLIYYGLLQILIIDNQKALDKEIIKLIKDVKIVKGNKGYDETIITRIRNMIGHPENIDIEELKTLVKQNIEALKKMVIVKLLN